MTVEKSTRLTIRLTEQARAWLAAEAEKRGLDEAAFARMIIFERMNGGYSTDRSAAVARAATGPAGENPTPATTPPSFEDFADEPRAEEMEIPPDPDGGDPHAQLDKLMEAGPSFFDDLITQAAPRAAAVATAVERAPATRRGYARTLPSRQGPQPAHGPPGSLTRAVGVNDSAVGYMGSAANTVLRDNMRHFGIVGTRSR
jgi:hypothetical protein